MDNIRLPAAPDDTGPLTATKELATVNGAAAPADLHVQRVQPGFGGPSDFQDVTLANPLPVQVPGPLPLPTGAATQATLQTLLTAAQAIQAAAEALNGKATAINTGAVAGTVAVSNFPVATGLTDTQLRATPVPVSGTFWQATQPVSFTWAGLTDSQLRAAPLALPVGAATEAKQDVANTSLAAIDLDLSTIIGLSDAVLTSYSVAGVIAVNSVLATVDCINRGAVSVHCVAMGTTGVVTPEWSNNNTDWLPATMFTAAGASATTFNAAGLWVLPVAARYLRLRLSTAATAGTTTLSVQALQQRAVPWLATQPVSMAAALAAGTNAIGDVGLQVRANATGASTTSHLVSAATTNAFNIKNAAGRVLGWSAVNTTASWQYVKLHNSATTPTAGAGVFMTIAIPPNGVNNCPPTLPGIGFSAGIGRTIVTGSADTDATATTAGAVVFDLFYA